MTECRDTSLFPGMLGLLARAGMAAEAEKLAAAWGGTKRYIPAKPTASSGICKVISLEAALVLAKVYGNRHHDIPLLSGGGGKKLALQRVNHLGTAAAARAVGCSARYVRMVRNQ